MSTLDPAIFRTPEFAKNPYPTLKLLRDHHPAYNFPGTNEWIVTRYEDVAAAFHDSEAYSSSAQADRVSRICGGRTMIEMDGREHKTYRNLASPVFMGKGLTGLLATVRRNTETLIEKFTVKHARRLATAAATSGEIDIVDDFSTRLPLSVIMDVLDLPQEAHEDFHRWYPLMIAGMSRPDYFEAGSRANASFHDCIDPLIDARSKNPGDDLISRLITAEIDGQRMSKQEIKAFTSLLFVGGAETTDKAIGNLWYWMLSNPDQLEKIQADPDNLLDLAFSEMMRIHPPASAMFRRTTRDIRLHDQTIPKDAMVALSIYGANRDERIFKDPDTFNIFREDLDRRFGAPRQGKAGHMGFGYGPHFCIGYELAQTEAVIGTRELLKVLKNPRFKAGTNPSPINMRAEPWQLIVEFDIA